MGGRTGWEAGRDDFKNESPHIEMWWGKLSFWDPGSLLGPFLGPKGPTSLILTFPQPNPGKKSDILGPRDPFGSFLGPRGFGTIPGAGREVLERPV